MPEQAEESQPKIDIGTAIQVYTEYLEAHPYSFIFVPLAHLYRRQGRFDEAMRLCQEGLRVFPGYLTARTALGLACCDKGDYRRARTELERVVSVMSDNVLARRTLAEIYLAEGDIEKALTHWRVIAGLFPDRPEPAQRVRKLEEELGAAVQRAPIEEPPREEVVTEEVPPSAPPEAEGPGVTVEEVEAERSVAAADRDEPLVSLPEEGFPPSVEEGEVGVLQKELPEGEGVPEPTFSFPREPGILAEIFGGLEEFEEFSERGEGESSISVQEVVPAEPSEAEGREVLDVQPVAQPLEDLEGLADVAPAFELISPPLAEEEVAGVGDRPAAEEEMVEDPRQQEMSFRVTVEEPGEVATQTLAELYEAQGHLDQAIQIYEALLEAQPFRDDLRDKVQELRREKAAALGAADDRSSRPQKVEMISIKSSPFFVRERSSGGESLVVGGSFVQEMYERKLADRERREAARKVVAEMEQWLKRLRGRDG